MNSNFYQNGNNPPQQGVQSYGSNTPSNNQQQAPQNYFAQNMVVTQTPQYFAQAPAAMYTQFQVPNQNVNSTTVQGVSTSPQGATQNYYQKEGQESYNQAEKGSNPYQFANNSQNPMQSQYFGYNPYYQGQLSGQTNQQNQNQNQGNANSQTGYPYSASSFPMMGSQQPNAFYYAANFQNQFNPYLMGYGVGANQAQTNPQNMQLFGNMIANANRDEKAQGASNQQNPGASQMNPFGNYTDQQNFYPYAMTAQMYGQNFQGNNSNNEEQSEDQKMKNQFGQANPFLNQQQGSQFQGFPNQMNFAQMQQQQQQQLQQQFGQMMQKETNPQESVSKPSQNQQQPKQEKKEQNTKNEKKEYSQKTQPSQKSSSAIKPSFSETKVQQIKKQVQPAKTKVAASSAKKQNSKQVLSYSLQKTAEKNPGSNSKIPTRGSSSRKEPIGKEDTPSNVRYMTRRMRKNIDDHDDSQFDDEEYEDEWGLKQQAYNLRNNKKQIAKKKRDPVNIDLRKDQNGQYYLEGQMPPLNKSSSQQSGQNQFSQFIPQFQGQHQFGANSSFTKPQHQPKEQAQTQSQNENNSSNKSQQPEGTDSQPNQVDFNTIASNFAGLISGMHNFSNQQQNPPQNGSPNKENETQALNSEGDLQEQQMQNEDSREQQQDQQQQQQEVPNQGFDPNLIANLAQILAMNQQQQQQPNEGQANIQQNLILQQNPAFMTGRNMESEQNDEQKQEDSANRQKTDEKNISEQPQNESPKNEQIIDESEEKKSENRANGKEEEEGQTKEREEDLKIDESPENIEQKIEKEEDAVETKIAEEEHQEEEIINRKEDQQKVQQEKEEEGETAIEDQKQQQEELQHELNQEQKISEQMEPIPQEPTPKDHAAKETKLNKLELMKLNSVLRKNNKDWVKTAKEFEEGKHDIKSLKKQYRDYFKKVLGERKKFTMKENLTILKYRQNFGIDIKEIASSLPTRSTHQICKHFYGCLRKPKNKDRLLDLLEKIEQELGPVDDIEYQQVAQFSTSQQEKMQQPITTNTNNNEFQIQEEANENQKEVKETNNENRDEEIEKQQEISKSASPNNSVADFTIEITPLQQEGGQKKLHQPPTEQAIVEEGKKDEVNEQTEQKDDEAEKEGNQQ